MREVFPTAASPRVTRVREWGETTWPLYTDILTLSPHTSHTLTEDRVLLCH